MKWTDDRVEMLRTLWNEGLTASQIADRLGGTTRNAVIGKAHRLGLGQRGSKASTGGVLEASAEGDACAAVVEVDIIAGRDDEHDGCEHDGGEPVAVDAAGADDADTQEAQIEAAAADPDAVEMAQAAEAAVEPTAVAGDAPEAEDETTDGDDKIDPINEETETDVQETELETANDEAMTAAALAAEVEKNARRLSLLELTERTCKWPIGDPSTDDFYFCGHRCSAEKPYCDAHSAIAYQPMSSRRDRERHRTRARALTA